MPSQKPDAEATVVWFERLKVRGGKGPVLICFANPRELNNLQQVKRKATDADFERYPKQYENFRFGEGEHKGNYVSDSHRAMNNGEF